MGINLYPPCCMCGKEWEGYGKGWSLICSKYRNKSETYCPQCLEELGDSAKEPEQPKDAFDKIPIKMIGGVPFLIFKKPGHCLVAVSQVLAISHLEGSSYKIGTVNNHEQIMGI